MKKMQNWKDYCQQKNKTTKKTHVLLQAETYNAQIQ